MNHDEIDRALSEEIRIEPSPGFASRVMQTARREASAPSPIPFPWKRALPALAAGALAFLEMIIAVVKSPGRPETAHAGLLSGLVHAVRAANMYGIGWILWTALATLASVALSLRFTTGTWRAR